MRYRKYAPSDYQIISPWFTGHGWPQGPSENLLPPTGIMVEDDEGRPLAAGFLYLTNCPLMGWVEWLVTDPTLGIAGFKALKYLIESIKEIARKLGMLKVIHLCKPEFDKIFEKKLGFKPTESATVMLLEVI